MVRQYRARAVTDPAWWRSLFSTATFPHMTQAWAFGDARQAAGQEWRLERRRIDAGGWRTRRLVFEDDDGKPLALCQLFEKSLGGICYATKIDRGPLILGADPPMSVVEGVYRSIRGRYRHVRRGALSLAPSLPATPESRLLLQRLSFHERHERGWRSTRVDLRENEDDLLRGLRATWRNRLRSAQRSDLTLRIGHSPSEVAWMADRHAENMARKGFMGPPAVLVKALHAAAPEDVIVYRAVLAEEPVGGMLIFRYGNSAAYYVGWMDAAGRKVNVSNFLYWEIALDLKRRGCTWFDLGGLGAPGIDQFKLGMGGEEYELLSHWRAY